MLKTIQDNPKTSLAIGLIIVFVIVGLAIYFSARPEDKAKSAVVESNQKAIKANTAVKDAAAAANAAVATGRPDKIKEAQEKQKEAIKAVNEAKKAETNAVIAVAELADKKEKDAKQAVNNAVVAANIAAATGDQSKIAEAEKKKGDAIIAVKEAEKAAEIATVIASKPTVVSAPVPLPPRVIDEVPVMTPPTVIAPPLIMQAPVGPTPTPALPTPDTVALNPKSPDPIEVQVTTGMKQPTIFDTITNILTPPAEPVDKIMPIQKMYLAELNDSLAASQQAYDNKTAELAIAEKQLKELQKLAAITKNNKPVDEKKRDISAINNELRRLKRVIDKINTRIAKVNDRIKTNFGPVDINNIHLYIGTAPIKANRTELIVKRVDNVINKKNQYENVIERIAMLQDKIDDVNDSPGPASLKAKTLEPLNKDMAILVMQRDAYKLGVTDAIGLLRAAIDRESFRTYANQSYYAIPGEPQRTEWFECHNPAVAIPSPSPIAMLSRFGNF